MDNELLEKCLENDKKAKDRIYALLNETIDIAEENRIPFFLLFWKGRIAFKWSVRGFDCSHIYFRS